MPTNIDICAGGTVTASNGTASITLVNHHHKICNIDDLDLPGADPAGPYAVPAKSGSTPGTLNITFDADENEEYEYEPDCCGAKETNPVIIVQT
jgi:hypothetical protein